MEKPKAFKSGFLIFISCILIFSAKAVFADNFAQVQTYPATNVSFEQATLNGYLSVPYMSGLNNYTWFQWGTDTNYTNTSLQQSSNYSGPFSQTILNLSSNTTYHYRAVAQLNAGQIVYGQDMTFSTNTGPNYYGNYGPATLSVQKQVINLTSGNLNWSSSVNANPLDILTFAITIRAYAKDAHNVYVSDILPANLISKGRLMLNQNQNYTGNISSEINIGTIPAGSAQVISYQVQVAPPSNFTFGATTITNSATVFSAETSTQTTSATVVVNNSSVRGVTTISTGLTNNIFTDSFFLPLLLLIVGLGFVCYRFRIII
jgi:hypothetical protein